MNSNNYTVKQHAMHHKFLPYTFVIISFLFSTISFSQTEQDVISEANRLEINSREKAISELASRGISVSQAKEMAQLRGIDFDSFLDNYLKNNNAGSKAAKATVSNDVVTDLKVTSAPVVVSVPTPPKVVVEKDIKNYFGYDIFVNNPFGQKEYLVGNIDEGYILAPGDELRITVFGDNNLEFVSKIDLNGNISFPNLGVFFAAGNSFATVKNRLKIFLGKYYSGLLSTPNRTFLDVSLTQIRPVKVSVLGNVTTPGPHLVNGLATVLNALYASGGISTSGTLRDVKVYRNNKLIKTIDLYDYITQGNIDQDIRLSNNDVLFVGPRISSIKLQGKVRKEAIYELKDGETLENLFKYSGGLSAVASTNAVNISRIKPFKDRNQELVYDRFLTTVNYSNQNSKGFPLTDGDVVTVQEILTKQKNKVFIEGNVNAPGSYGLDIYKDLKTLINTGAKGVSINTYFQKLDINREDDQGNLSFKTYNLSSVLNDKVTVTLQENDRIKIYSLEEVQGEQTVTISGFVSEPKTVFWSENLSIFDLIFQSVSYDELEFQSKVLTSRLDLKRFDKQTGLYNLTQYSIDNLKDLKTTYLLPKDEVVLYTKSVTEDISPTFRVLGVVNNPGEFSLGNSMYVEDAILMAGGFLEEAEKTYVNINRLDRNLETGSYSKLETYQVDMDYLLGVTKTPRTPFILQNKDIVSVFAPIRAFKQPVISVRGEITYPQNIVLENDEISMKKIIDLAGGFTTNSNIKSSYIVRDSLKLFVDLDKSLDNQSTFLIDEDILVIGSNLDPIKTSGGLLNPTIFSWDKGKKAKYYIKKSGGTKKRIESMVVLQANGKSEKIGLFKNPTVYPGAQIIVTEKPEKIDDGKNKFLDDFVRIFSVVTGALTTIVLTKNL
ncbi:SLBB domain-containing protein [Flavobacteriaceae bacterium]|nr:SLBB domain-containing protein [Flavobacteriaceae bacterium]